MKSLAVRCYPPDSARLRVAQLTWDPTGHLQLAFEDGEVVELNWSELEVREPLGRQPRIIYLRDGTRCEAEDLEGFRALENAFGVNRAWKFIDSMERHWRSAVLALVGVIICSWLLIQFGTPVLADRVARSLPPEIPREIGSRTLEQLDRVFLEPSELSPTRRRPWKRRFETLVFGLDIDPSRYRLEFRSGAGVGPNAFALPGGIVIVTDPMIALFENEAEFDAVMLHEIAHVELRHNERAILQHAGIFLVASVVLGDVSSITAAAGALPSFLIESSYSRGMESEADAFAVRELLRLHGDADALVRLLERLEEEAGADIPEILSSHPLGENRVGAIRALESGMRQQSSPGATDDGF